MSRKFSYLTVKTILEELESEGVKITRVNFYRLEKRLKFPIAKRTSAKLQWRVYTRKQIDKIKNKIKEEYNINGQEEDQYLNNEQLNENTPTLYRYNLIIPNDPVNFEDTCEAKTKEEAAEIFTKKINTALNEEAWNVHEIMQYIK